MDRVRQLSGQATLQALTLTDLARRHGRPQLAGALLMGGKAMALARESGPCSGLEHIVSRVLTKRLGARAPMHGEQVALAALLVAEAWHPLLAHVVRNAFLRLGLPRFPADVGLSEADLEVALVDACASAPTQLSWLTPTVARVRRPSLRRAFDSGGPPDPVHSVSWPALSAALDSALHATRVPASFAPPFAPLGAEYASRR